MVNEQHNENDQIANEESVQTFANAELNSVASIPTNILFVSLNEMEITDMIDVEPNLLDKDETPFLGFPSDIAISRYEHNHKGLTETECKNKIKNILREFPSPKECAEIIKRKLESCTLNQPPVNSKSNVNNNEMEMTDMIAVKPNLLDKDEAPFLGFPSDVAKRKRLPTFDQNYCQKVRCGEFPVPKHCFVRLERVSENHITNETRKCTLEQVTTLGEKLSLSLNKMDSKIKCEECPEPKQCFVSIQRLSQRFLENESWKCFTNGQNCSVNPKFTSRLHLQQNFGCKDDKNTLEITSEEKTNVGLPNDWQCCYNECKKAFSQKQNLAQHIKAVHLKLKPFKCYECEKPFSFKADLQKHLLSVHEKLKPFKCCECEKYYNHIFDLRGHIQAIHKKLRPYKCCECEKYFSYKKSLQIHVRVVHRKLKKVICNECEKHFSSKGDMLRHVQAVHKKLKPFKCCECEKYFSSKFSLRMHVQVVHEKLKPFKCCECDMIFSTKNILACHFNSIHKKLKPFQCSECKKYFCRKAHLANHILAVHKKFKPFQCNECEKAFCSKENLGSHILNYHEQLKPFQCCECGKLFGFKASLLLHMQGVHEKLKPYKCNQCEKSFSSKRYVAVHIRAVHEKLKPFKCNECEKYFSTKKYATDHMQAVHEKLKPFETLKHKCNECGKCFSTKKYATDHMQVVHKKL